MRASKRLAALAALALISVPAFGQEAEAGIAVPITITGGALYSRRMQGDNPAAGPFAGAFHAAFSPSLRWNAHWFAYASIQLRSTPFYYYDAFEADHQVDVRAIQAFVGYTATYKSATILIKAGQLATAFGSFPLHYDDADNPLLDQPLSYATDLKPPLPPACSTPPSAVTQGGPSNSGGCAQGNYYGYTPVTLYGLPGVELDVSVHNLDTRVQFTNSSPANPQSLLSGSQHAQWTAGGGYTVVPGLRVGGSAFRGPYLDRETAAWLPAGTILGAFPATGAGVDAQWARGRWSLSGEWQWFRFDCPGFRKSPEAAIAYAEVKAVLTPRLYAAIRLSGERNGRVAEAGQAAAANFQPNVQSYEFALGFRPSRWELCKIGYEWYRTSDAPGTRDNVLGVQLVTMLPSLSKSWR